MNRQVLIIYLMNTIVGSREPIVLVFYVLNSINSMAFTVYVSKFCFTLITIYLLSIILDFRNFMF